MKQLILMMLLLLLGQFATAQNKMDLDDVSIKGQLHDDGRLRMVSRDEYQITNHVRLRRSFKAQIVEELPRPAPQIKYHY